VERRRRRGHALVDGELVADARVRAAGEGHRASPQARDGLRALRDAAVRPPLRAAQRAQHHQRAHSHSPASGPHIASSRFTSRMGTNTLSPSPVRGGRRTAQRAGAGGDARGDGHGRVQAQRLAQHRVEQRERVHGERRVPRRARGQPVRAALGAQRRLHVRPLCEREDRPGEQRRRRLVPRNEKRRDFCACD
jgi:hypothetical protein